MTDKKSKNNIYHKSRWHTMEDKIFMLVMNILLFIFFLIVLYPLIYIVSMSFSSTEAIYAGKVWLYPVNPTFVGYEAVFKNKWILTGYFNSTFYAIAGTAINVFMTIICAYPLSRKKLKGQNVVMFIFTFTMFFSGGLIPTYLLISNLGLINKRLVMLIPGAMSVWNMIITRTYFQANIPDELLEASQLDGCNDYRFLWHVVFPLSGAIIAVISLFYAVAHWNSYFAALIYLSDRAKMPLQIVLREILVLNDIDVLMMQGAKLEDLEAKLALSELLKYALIVVASVPVMIIYPFVQKYFVKGIMIGSLKG